VVNVPASAAATIPAAHFFDLDHVLI